MSNSKATNRREFLKLSGSALLAAPAMGIAAESLQGMAISDSSLNLFIGYSADGEHIQAAERVSSAGNQLSGKLQIELHEGSFESTANSQALDVDLLTTIQGQTLPLHMLSYRQAPVSSQSSANHFKLPMPEQGLLLQITRSSIKPESQGLSQRLITGLKQPAIHEAGICELKTAQGLCAGSYILAWTANNKAPNWSAYRIKQDQESGLTITHANQDDFDFIALNVTQA